MRQRLYTALLAVVFSLAAVGSFADVTIKTTTLVSGPASTEVASSVYIKGARMRTDAKVGGQDLSILVDLATKERLMVNHGTKEVQEFDPVGSMAGMPVTVGEPTVSLKPTGEKKVVLGRNCQGFAMQVTMPMTVAGETVTLVMSGPAWISADAPGVAEYQRFFKGAAEAGLNTSLMTQGPQSKGMAEMQRVLAGNGIPLDQELRVSVEGTGQVAMAMGQAAMSITNRVTEISAAPIADDLFAVPAGYTKK